MTRKRATARPFGFVRYRKDRARPYLAGFNPPAGGPEVTRAFGTEADADIWLAEQHVAVARGAFVDMGGAKTLLGDYWKSAWPNADWRRARGRPTPLTAGSTFSPPSVIARSGACAATNYRPG